MPEIAKVKVDMSSLQGRYYKLVEMLKNLQEHKLSILLIGKVIRVSSNS